VSVQERQRARERERVSVVVCVFTCMHPLQKDADRRNINFQ